MYKTFLALISPFALGVFALSVFSLIAFIIGSLNGSIPDDPGNMGFYFLFAFFFILFGFILKSVFNWFRYKKTNP